MALERMGDLIWVLKNAEEFSVRGRGGGVDAQHERMKGMVGSAIYIYTPSGPKMLLTEYLLCATTTLFNSPAGRYYSCLSQARELGLRQELNPSPPKPSSTFQESLRGRERQEDEGRQGKACWAP